MNATASGWAPLRTQAFRRLWLAQFTRQRRHVDADSRGAVGDDVVDRVGALAQRDPAAASIPVLLLVVPAGVLGDLVDRRLVILVSQATMLIAAAALAVLAAAGSLTPWVLLGLLFVIGVGGAVKRADVGKRSSQELVPARIARRRLRWGPSTRTSRGRSGPRSAGCCWRRRARPWCSSPTRCRSSRCSCGGGDGRGGAQADDAARARRSPRSVRRALRRELPRSARR